MVRRIGTLTKPMLMAALLLAFIVWLWPGRTAVLGLGMLALALSRARDCLLQTPGDRGFLAGLGSFLLAHPAYLVLFAGVLRRQRVPLLALAYLAWRVALLVIVGPWLGSLSVLGHPACAEAVPAGFSLGQADFLIMALYLAGQGVLIAGVIRMTRVVSLARPVTPRE